MRASRAAARRRWLQPATALMPARFDALAGLWPREGSRQTANGDACRGARTPAPTSCVVLRPRAAGLAFGRVGLVGRRRTSQARLGVPGLILLSFSVWGVWMVARTLVLGRSARRAELANMGRLVQFGHPYPARPPAGLLPASVSARIAGVILAWVIFDLSYGA